MTRSTQELRDAPVTLAEMFDRALADRPDAIFARFGDDSFSLRELDAMVQRVGISMRREGVGAGERVAAFMYPSPWHLAVVLACARYGFVWCPVNVSLARGDLAYTLEDLSPKLIIVDEELQKPLASSAADQPWIAGVPRAVLNEPEGAEAPFADAWLAGTGDVPDDLAPVEILPSDSFAIIYSGGTTGRPKGLEVSQFYPVSAAYRLNDVASFGVRETFFSSLQFAHAWTPLTVMPFCLHYDHVFAFWKWWSASAFVDAVRGFGATIIDPYVGMVATLLHTPARPDDRDIPATRCIAGLGGAEATSVRIRRDFEERFGVTSLQMYSLTEVGPLACVEVESEERRFGSSGKTRGWYEIRIADAVGMPLDAGEVGEILVRPLYPNVMAKAYINRAEDTLRSWRDLWVHTGDLGRFDTDGYLYFVGRQAHFIRRRGELVSAGEVEETLSELPAVQEVAVVGVPSALGEEDVKAFVVVKQGARLDAREVVEHCAERLAYFKVPTYVELVDEMPRSATKQEIERYQLRARPAGDPVTR